MTQLDRRGIVEVSDGGVSVDIKGESMTLNIGPQHPSTHGVLRLVAEVDGERISKLDPAIGYMHRGNEKLAEVRNYAQITALINRIDWVSGFANEVAFIRAVEKLMGIEPTPRAQMIRLILTELTRISNHLVFASSYPLELGAATPLMWAFREREYIMDVIESATGGRFHPNFNRVGGVKAAAGGGKTQKKVSLDLPAGFYAAVENAMDRAEPVGIPLRRKVRRQQRGNNARNHWHRKLLQKPDNALLLLITHNLALFVLRVFNGTSGMPLRGTELHP